MGTGAGLGEGRQWGPDTRACAGLGSGVWEDVSGWGGRRRCEGRVLVLIPPVQESRNLCCRVKEQNYTWESFCSERQ